MTRADGGATPPAVGDRIRAHWPSGARQDVIVLRAVPVAGELLVRALNGLTKYAPADLVEQLPPLPPCGDPEHRHWPGYRGCNVIADRGKSRQ